MTASLPGCGSEVRRDRWVRGGGDSTAVLGVVLGLAGALAAAGRRRPRRGRSSTSNRPSSAGSATLRAQRELVGEQLRQGIDGARRALEELRTRDQERRATDAEQREVVRRLATVLAGGASKGRRGRARPARAPRATAAGMLAYDLRVNGKVVEFGLVLPDGRRLPIDSKWTALAELEALEAATDPVDRDACARAVEKAVVTRVKEVAQYLDPALTAPVAVAAVPDAVYTVLKRAHADAYATASSSSRTATRCRSCCSSTRWCAALRGRRRRARRAWRRSAVCSRRWRRSWRTGSRGRRRCSRTAQTSSGRSSARRGAR